VRLLAHAESCPHGVTTPPETDLSGLSARAVGADEAPKRFQDFTVASAIVFAFAIATVLTLPSVKFTHAVDQAMPLALTFPHLTIIALMAAGFRRRGDILAWILAMPLLFILPVVGFLSGMGAGYEEPALFKLAFFQLVIVLAAGADLERNKKLTPQPVASRDRWIGLVVPVIVLIATSAITNSKVRPREKQSDSTEDSTVTAAWFDDPMLDDVVRTARCVEEFRGDSVAGRAPKSLSEAHCADSIGQHHRVYYAPPKDLRGDPFHRAAFTLGIEAVWDPAESPDAIGHPGTRNYFLDAAGDIHVTAEHRRATVGDPIVPECPLQGEMPNQAECRPPFASRERWGLVHDQPRFSIRLSNFDSRDSVLASLYFHQVSALDSVRLVSIDWGEGQAPTVLDVKPAESITRITMTGGTASINEFQPSVSHRYSTFGRKVVTAQLLTRSGAEFVATGVVTIANLTPKSQ
jgi:hypothetical protein